jgi:hypothetical protein
MAETPMTGRDAFFATIRQALGRAPGDGPPNDAALLPDAGALDERAAAIIEDQQIQISPIPPEKLHSWRVPARATWMR